MSENVYRLGKIVLLAIAVFGFLYFASLFVQNGRYQYFPGHPGNNGSAPNMVFDPGPGPPNNVKRTIIAEKTQRDKGIVPSSRNLLIEPFLKLTVG